MPTYEGGCHCGRVRYRVVAELTEVGAIRECNCSMCTMKGFLHLIVPLDRFALSSGASDLATYHFNTHTAKHHFCRHCGVHSFYIPRSDPDKVDVNVRCLDGVDPTTLSVTPFDGRHWEQAMAARPDAR
jgi:hypothetical protein